MIFLNETKYKLYEITVFEVVSNVNVCICRYIKAALLPMQPPANHVCCTKPVMDLHKPTFGETFPIAVPLNKLYTKTLQVNVWCTSGESEECLVSSIATNKRNVYLNSFYRSSVNIVCLNNKYIYFIVYNYLFY